jgi:predicted transcriptional regulator of viral defense system
VNQAEQILEMAKSTHGIITSSQIDEAGIARQYLKFLVDTNQLAKAGRGIYVLPDTWEDELFILQYRYNKGIYSHESALFLHDYSDRTPAQWTMTFLMDTIRHHLPAMLLLKRLLKNYTISELLQSIRLRAILYGFIPLSEPCVILFGGIMQLIFS